MRIFLISIDDILEEAGRRDSETPAIDIVGGMTEEGCRRMVEESTDEFPGEFTPEQFEAGFNHDTRSVFNSDYYFIRIFP